MADETLCHSGVRKLLAAALSQILSPESKRINEKESPLRTCWQLLHEFPKKKKVKKVKKGESNLI